MLSEYNDSGQLLRWFVYGNYIDEVLTMNDGSMYYYVHDHLYSPVALLSNTGTVLKRCEYDACGNYRKCPQDKQSFLILKTS